MSRTRSLSDEAARVRLDLLMAWWPFTSGSLRASIETLLEEVRHGGWSSEREAEFLRYAEASWPARRATERFARTRPDIFWSVLVPRCLPTTQVLLKRLAEQEGHERFHDLYRAPQADFALHEAERTELALLVPQIHALLWRDHEEKMRAFLDAAQEEQRQMKALLDGKAAVGACSAYEHAMMYADELAVFSADQ